MFKVSGLWTGAVGRIAVASAVCFLQAAAAGAGQLIISEFRLRGPSGATDEFIEIYNNTDSPHTVSGVGTGYGIVASDGVARCVIPNGTILPARGHYLCVNSALYSLAGYPAGNGTTATGDATFTTDIPDNAGVALFNTSLAGGFILANRLDAVGSTAEVNTLYKEGVGYPALTPFSIDYSFVRKVPGGCTGAGGGNCSSALLAQTTAGPSTTALQDTDVNATDFILFVDTNGTSAGAGQRLGAPGPQNLSSPISLDGYALAGAKLDSCERRDESPNLVRDFTSDPGNNSTFGTLDIRHTFTNNTGGDLTRLRLRILDITTFPSPSGVADLRPRTSPDIVVSVNRAACGTALSTVLVQWNDPGNTPFAAQRFRFQRFAVGRFGHAGDSAGGRRLRGRALPARHPADGRRAFLCRPRDAARIVLAGVLFHRLD